MNEELIDIAMCVDCAMWHANGELPDSANEERCKQITDPSGIADSETGDQYSCYVAVVGDETFFTWSPCDLCEQHLGGDRIDGVLIIH